MLNYFKKLVTKYKNAKNFNFQVVSKSMRNSDTNKLIVWAIKILKQQFEKDPYSLSSDELMAIKLYDMKYKEKFKK